MQTPHSTVLIRGSDRCGEFFLYVVVISLSDDGRHAYIYILIQLFGLYYY